ncbi:hypothetical protein B0H12DRAFT_723500 [Mycena haematopus]|nr:hypothetical protein B0H12DRAFT_723500 [Mycena haematopus]
MGPIPCAAKLVLLRTSSTQLTASFVDLIHRMPKFPCSIPQASSGGGNERPVEPSADWKMTQGASTPALNNEGTFVEDCRVRSYIVECQHSRARSVQNLLARRVALATGQCAFSTGLHFGCRPTSRKLLPRSLPKYGFWKFSCIRLPRSCPSLTVSNLKTMVSSIRASTRFNSHLRRVL